jgi:hypothetical protein
MNAHDVLMYGHLWVHKHVDRLTDPHQWLEPGVCGVWSVKEIIAHLASFECLLVDVFHSTAESGSTPILNQFTSMNGDAFNAAQVSQRAGKSPAEVLAEYDANYEEVMRLLGKLDQDTLRQPGLIPWYGKEYSLEDLIVYQYYGHKREHMAQVAVYRDKLKARGE